MKITFLGTGTSQGVPIIACDCPVCRSIDFRDKRLRSSVWVEINGKHIIIDTGPDFRQQMLRLRATELHAVLFTHQHKDHIAGLDDVRAFNFRSKRNMPIWGNDITINRIKEEFYYAFLENPYPGVPRLEPQIIENQPFDVEGIQVIPIQVMHHKLPVVGFRIGDFTYITDANFISEEEKEKIKGSQVLVINALQREPHISHFTVSQALDLVSELQIPKAYFTHISHKLGKHVEVNATLPNHVELAYDGLTINI